MVPDGELYLTKYADIVRGLNRSALPYFSSDRYGDIYSPIMSVNRIFHSHNHHFIYDYSTVSLLLEKNGFVDIKKECYKQSRDPRLIIDTPQRAVESLYVEASKP